MERIETADEFWDYYTLGDKAERQILQQHGRRPVPCDCGDEKCTGWQMLRPHDRFNYGDDLGEN
jgi:hypothetical protein